MDAFSRLLVSIGQSLGKGLGQVGQTELEQRQRLEVLEAQRKANISGQLLQTFTQLLQTQGIQEVAPEGIEAIRKAVTDLALGKIDSPSVQEAISVFPTVAQAANKISVYRELATKDPDSLARILVNTPENEARALLGAIGLEGIYDGLRARGEVLTQADKLGLRLTEEQIGLISAQRKEILDKLGPTIELLRAQARQADAATQKMLAETEALIMRLPLEIEKLKLDIENGKLTIQEAEIRVKNLQREIDARIGEILSRTALNEAQRGKVLAEIEEVKARTEVWFADAVLKKEQAALANAQRTEIMTKLGPSIQLLEAQAKLADSQAQLAVAQAKALLEKLPYEVQKLILDVENGQLTIEEAKVKLQNLQREIDTKIDEAISRTRLNEAQRDRVLSEIREINARAEGWLADAELKRAQARKVGVETQELETRLKFLESEYKIKLSKEGLELLKAVYVTQMTDPERIKNILRGIPGLDFIISDEETLNAVAKSLADDVKKFIYERDLKIGQEEIRFFESAIKLAVTVPNPRVVKESLEGILPESMPKEKRRLLSQMASFISAVTSGKVTTELIQEFAKVVPPKESRSGILRILYDTLITMHDGTEEGKKQAKALANAVVNTIKFTWDYNEDIQNLQKLKLLSETELNNARAAHERVLAQLEPRKLNLKQEEFKLDEWYKKEWIKINWEKLNLERLELAAKEAQVKDSTLQDLKTIADTANKLHDAAVGMLEFRLRELGFNECANELNTVGSLTYLEAIRGRTGDECNEAVKFILNNPQDEKNRKVIRAIEGAQNAKLRAISLFNAVIGGEALPTSPAPGAPTPGGTSPATPGAGNRPSGTAAPGSTPSGTTGGALGSDFASGAKAAYNMLKGFGVQIPNDFKEAGAMVFTFGTEQGKRYNPFEIKESSGVTMQEITIEEGGQKKKVKVPVGPDKGFREAIKADKDGKGARQKALDIDSAIAFGIAWIFPNEADKPSMLAEYIREDFRRNNRGLFRRAEYFKSKEGYVDIASVAAAYASMSLERLGVRVQYTKLFTTLLRVLAENDLDMLRMPRPLPPEKAKERYLNMVKSRFGSDRELLEDARKRFGLPPNAPREKVLEEILKSAASLYDATRLSNIGRLVLGGGR